MLAILGEVLKEVKKRKSDQDDLVDRLNYRHSVVILLFFALCISAKQFVGSPMQCWVPAEYTKSWEQYSETYCFAQGTYFLYSDEQIVPRILPMEDRRIGYYQWVPIVLAVQAFLFYLPHLIWEWFSGLSGIKVKSLLSMAETAAGFDPEKREKNLEMLSRAIAYSLKIEFSMTKRSGFGICGLLGMGRCRSWGCYLTWLYTLFKIFNLINVISQIFFIDTFLQADRWFWSGQILSDLVRGRPWTESGRFPRVTICQILVRELGGKLNLRRDHFQCVLVINMWNEKVYLFLWCWMVLVACCTFWNLLEWLAFCRPASKRRYVKKHLKIGLPSGWAGLKSADKHIFKEFLHKGLKSDGVLLLRFISGHVGDLIATEIAALVFQEFVEKAQKECEECEGGMEPVTTFINADGEILVSRKHVVAGMQMA